jgi:hypothetical protein
MLGAVPAVTVMKDLMSPRRALKLYDKDRFDARTLAGGSPRIQRLDGNALREEVELAHVDDIGAKNAFKVTARRPSFFPRERCDSTHASSTRSFPYSAAGSGG